MLSQLQFGVKNMLGMKCNQT